MDPILLEHWFQFKFILKGFPLFVFLLLSSYIPKNKVCTAGYQTACNSTVKILADKALSQWKLKSIKSSKASS